ncbi:MAG: class I SAM-dependent methyltransferase [Bacteroidales bacterium]|jgi:ubiquinone/menaquinone biosynthesis C-methylase UbiE|nr:class I SAM-dependent methyltransferase [Bacteroidales bacterium]
MNITHIEERFSQIAQQYDAQRRLFIPCFDDYYGLGVSFLKRVKPSVRTVLDLGAGTGILTKRLYDEYPKAEFSLVDISEKMLEVARQRFSGLENFHYAVLDYSQNLPKQKFDVIASALSIHHLEHEDKKRLYASIYEHLEEGGVLLNLDQFNATSAEMNDRYNHYWYEHIHASGISAEEQAAWSKRRELDRENTVDETKQMLTTVGFRNVECLYEYMKFGLIFAEK